MATMDEGRPTDQEIAAHHEAVQREQEEKPLVGPCEPTSSLLTEFSQPGAFRTKCEHICKEYASIRRVRRDGNCFVRAYCFAVLEWLASRPDHATCEDSVRLKALFGGATAYMVQQGFPEFGVEDFCEMAAEQMNNVVEGKYTGPEGRTRLVEAFNDACVSEYLVCFMRFLTSAFLREHTPEYEMFIESGLPMHEYCRTQVEPMRRESEHLSITALARAIAVPVAIVYLDNSVADQPTVHTFPDTTDAPITLLYRPGHYDVLYKAE
eukprot:TRINITY_DN13138_c0_g1_i1.p1 TRINITY_DN13138_c0_g1~~TRINITY_DN13138_c0_g1_i1.p1  ORF type:complete len:266 (+),score=88.98 TRINITY_DN13138_c0_g1_i1:234-1031(+)